MALRSTLFAGNRRLNLAAQNSPALKPGERGEAVWLLQLALYDLGYSLPRSTRRDGTLDRIYGREMLTTVRRVEERYGLSLDRGIAGREVLRTIDERLRFDPEQFNHTMQTTHPAPPTHPLPVDERITQIEAMRALTQIDYDVLNIPANQRPDPAEHAAITFLRGQGFDNYNILQFWQHLAAGEYAKASDFYLTKLGNLASLVSNIEICVELTGGSFGHGAGMAAFGLAGIGGFVASYSILRHILLDLPEWMNQLEYCMYYVPCVSGGVTSRVYGDPAMYPRAWLSRHAAQMVDAFNAADLEMHAARHQEIADRALRQAHRNQNQLTISHDFRRRTVGGNGPHICWAKVGENLVSKIGDSRMRRYVANFTVRVLNLHTPSYPGQR
jgi:peptidoglycan hydrolase-like protein with peptidoglycan-binding domain